MPPQPLLAVHMQRYIIELNFLLRPTRVKLKYLQVHSYIAQALGFQVAFIARSVFRRGRPVK